MIAKNRIFDAFIDGKKIQPKDDYERECVRTYNDVQLCRIFGRTPSDIAEMPVDFYQDAILILAKESDKRRMEAEKRDRESKTRRR